MKKLSIVAMLCISLFFSCTTSIEPPAFNDLKGNSSENTSSSSSQSDSPNNPVPNNPIDTNSSSSSRSSSSRSNLSSSNQQATISSSSYTVITMSSSSINNTTLPSSASRSSASVVASLYCDYGYPTSYGGGCLLDSGDCNLEWGKLTTSCSSRTDLIYCQRSSTHCYSRTTTSCDAGDTKVSSCPKSTLCTTSDCEYRCADDYGPYGCTGSTPTPTPSSSSNVSGGSLYCDYGYPTSYGGGCVLVRDSDDCNLEWGKLVTSCSGRTDLIYCQRSTSHCYSRTTASCDAGDTKVSSCPQSTLCTASDCDYRCSNDYGPYGCN